MADDAANAHAPTEDEHDHDHGAAAFAGTDVDDATIEMIKPLHPALAEVLELTRRFDALTDDEKARAAELQRQVEQTPGWAPAFYADGDKCAGCGEPTSVLFTDKFANEGRLEYGAVLFDLPVHPRAECLDKAAARFPRPSPMLLDRARRELVKVGARPGAKMTNFYRHDVIAHPPFTLEDWANSVSDANPGGFDRATKKDIERVLLWVHQRVYHGDGSESSAEDSATAR